MDYQMVKEQSHQSIPSYRPNVYIRGLSMSYREANNCSTKSANRYGHTDFNISSTAVIMGMTLPEKCSTKTLPHAESRDAEVCKWNILSSFLRAEANLLYGEYDYQL
jgi:hypothetical protein